MKKKDAVPQYELKKLPVNMTLKSPFNSQVVKVLFNVNAHYS